METLKEKIEFLKKCETGYFADSFVRLGMNDKMLAYTVNSSRCHPLNFEDSFAGQAVTVRFSPALPGQGGKGLFDIFTEADPGSVVVMSGIPDGRCYMGDTLARYATVRNMGAVVAEGFIRDVRGAAKAGIPIFCQGGTTAAKGKELYTITAVNEPIHFHGIVIHPGDVVVGDACGIICIPLSIFDVVFEDVLKVYKYEEDFTKALENGGENILENLKAVSART